VKYVSDVIVSPSGGDAYVIGLYRCYGGMANTHLWVSVKLGRSAGELQRNWQVQRIDLKPETFETGAVFPPLESGTGFVQFCLFDSTAPPNDDNPSQGFAFNYSMKHVIAL